jgi:hypothetical protein
MHRPTPFDLIFDRVADERFPAVRAALESAGSDPHDRDAFLMIRDAIQLVRDLRPDEGVGEAIDQLVALVHHAYLFWAAGARVLELAPDGLATLLGGGATQDADPADGGPVAPDGAPPFAYYAQLPGHRVWAEVIERQPHEPLDGCFVHSVPDGTLRVLGVFGIHPERQGFSVVEAIGPRAGVLAREDGAALYAAVLPGGGAAGLHSIVGEEELLELGWRTRAVAAAAGAAP